MTASRYERIRSDLPWGWWMRSGPRGLEDGEGGVWADVRTAFWEGRLGMRSGHLAREQQEMLLRVLTSMGTRMVERGEERQDLFGGDDWFWRFYMSWLSSVGLTEQTTHFSVVGTITDEGRAVARMLAATREPAWADLPLRELVEAVRRADRGEADDAREVALRAFERGLTPLPHVFARECVGRVHVLTLTSIDLADRMPTRRVVWSASFQDERPRDDLFGWLAERVHRWEDWGGIARSKGAAALTTHFLALLVVSPVGASRRGDASGASS
ncbi:hypothetical protein [Sphingomonas bacterium]|uniref:hypothetical protein n=1 Tax=Sphingomonas bacterium TaxID=1895847 RepID=UPI0020C73DD6|nr:hypothetical protein [Sphingomonas bacterium]